MAGTLYTTTPTIIIVRRNTKNNLDFLKLESPCHHPDAACVQVMDKSFAVSIGESVSPYGYGPPARISSVL